MTRYTHITQAALLTLCLASLPVLAQTSKKPGYQPFPKNPKYEYPTRWSDIETWMEKDNWGKVRNHGWRLFIGANQPASANPDSQLRVFETWYTIPETFAPSATPKLLGTENKTAAATAARPLPHRKALNRAHTVSFGDHGISISPNYTSSCKFEGTRFLNNGDLMIAGVYFSENFYRHVRDKKYYEQETLNGIWQGGPSAVKNFPNRTFQVKHMFWPVPQDNYAALPVFPDFNPAPDPRNKNRPIRPTNPANYNGYETWNEAVAITAGKPSRNPVDASYAWRDYRGVPAVSVKDFYHTQIGENAYSQLDDTDKCILNQSANGVYGRDFRPGDYLVTIAMHVMVRENADVKSGLLPNAKKPKKLQNTWSLQTFWYEGAAAGDGGTSRYSANKPSKDFKAGAWKNYAMCQSYDPVMPREGDGTPHVCTNPYIELVVPETSRSVSSCITCHMAGAYPHADSLTNTMPGRAHYNSEQRGAVEMEYYRGLLYTDFSWSMPLSARPD